MKIGKHKKRFRRWFEQNGSEVPDSLFSAAYHAWLTLLTCDQAVFDRSELLQRYAADSIGAFIAAKQGWENR